MPETKSTQTTTKGELDDTGARWTAVRWLDTDYVECSPVVAAHGQWASSDRVEVIDHPVGHLCDAHREMVGTVDGWTEDYLRTVCPLAQ